MKYPIGYLSFPLFKQRGFGDILHIVVKEQRICYFIENEWDMYVGKTKPITDEVLGTFELTPEGLDFMKKYLM